MSQPNDVPPPVPPPGYGWPGAPAAAAPPPAPPVAGRSSDLAGDLRTAGLFVGVLIVLGVVSGVVWGRISPHSPGYVVAAHEVIPDEKEQFIGGDARYLIITGVVGLVAGALAWAWRDRRGPVVAAGLAIGALAGGLLCAWIGRLVGGGQESGAVGSAIRLPISLHSHGLLVMEAFLALAVYLVGTLLCGPDDLGRGRPTIEPDAPLDAGDSVPAGLHQ